MIQPPGNEKANIKERLNRAISRWWGRKRAINSIIAKATPYQKQEILASPDLVERLKSKLSYSDMRQVLSELNAPLLDQLEHCLEGAKYAQDMVYLIENASDMEKQQIANHSGLMSHIMTSFREDYKRQVIHKLNLLAIEMFTNYPNNNNRVGFTSLMVLTQEKLIISKEVNFVPAGTYQDDKEGFEALKERFIAVVTTYLSDKFQLKIESVGGTVGEYPIIVKLSQNPAADYRLILYGGIHGRGGVTRFRGHIYQLGEEEEGETRVPDVYLAHEAAHLILGADDEYDYTWLPGTVVYKDHSLMGNFYQEGIDRAEIKKRHFHFLLPLVSRWLSDCTISIITKNTPNIK